MGRPCHTSGSTTTSSRPTLSSRDRKSTRLNSSHANISYAVFCLKKKKNSPQPTYRLYPSFHDISHPIHNLYLPLTHILYQPITKHKYTLHLQLRPSPLLPSYHPL